MTETTTDGLSSAATFCKAAEALSFTVAARALGMTPSAVSKAVGRLEKRLGVQLFRRTTRTIRLTDQGRAYFQVCRQALAEIEAVETALSSGRDSPHGTLRVSLPFSYGIKCVIPLIPRYVERYDHRVKVVASLSNALTDFVTDDFGLSIRIGTVGDSRLVARLLRVCQYRVVASPAYVRTYGIPRRPEDLLAHRCIDQILPDTGKSIPWEFCEHGRCWDVRVPFHLVFDHPLAVVAAAASGAGYARMLDFTVEADLRAGTLVEVLAGFREPGEPVSAVYPRSRHLSANVRSFVAFLMEAGLGTRPARNAAR